MIIRLFDTQLGSGLMLLNKDQLKQMAVRIMTNGGVKSKQTKNTDPVNKDRISTVKKASLDILGLLSKR